MTLALIVLFAVSGNILEIPRLAAGRQDQSTTQQAPASSQEQPPDHGGQGATSPSNTTPSASTPPKAPSTQPKASVRRRRHKKKVVAQNCNTSTTGTGSSPETSATAAAPTGQAAEPPCPPSKTIVRHGGTSEPSIQLAGDQPPKQRDDTNQMLNSTDANLKKLEGRQLSANQQDMVGQVRQFMQQSRTAMEAGDFARSRTLAWKAQLLSEELVNPPK